MPRVPAVASAHVRPAGGKCEAADAQEASGESLCCGSSSCSQSRPPGFDLWAKQVQKQNRTPSACRTNDSTSCLTQVWFVIYWILLLFFIAGVHLTCVYL